MMPTWAVAQTGSSRATDSGRFPVHEVAAFAKDVERSLAESGVRLAFIARAGRPSDELPVGVTFTHVGIAVYSKIQTSDGRLLPGYATYNLYQNADQSNKSELVQDYLLDFFLGVQELKAGIIIPQRKLQKKLLEMISAGSWRELHNPRYSLIANPFTSQYQNCTEFILDIMHAAIYQTMDRSRIKAITRDFYSPYRIRKNPLAVVVGGMLRKEIAVTDHDGAFTTSTFGSIAEYMTEYGLAERVYTYRDGADSFHDRQ